MGAPLAAVSEPHAIGKHVAQLVARPEARPKALGAWLAQPPARALAAAMRAQLKDFGRETLVCVKLHSEGTSLVPLLARVFPEVKQLYLYRDPRPTVDSFIRFNRAFFPPFITFLERYGCGPAG